MVSRIRQYNQRTVDVARDIAANARAIGVLKQDTTRLTAVSALTNNDKVDFFKFKVEKNLTDVGLSVRTYNGDVRIQLLDKLGRTVIADNGKGATDLQKSNYEKLISGDTDLSAGVYVLKITRADGVLDSVKPNYIIQLTAGSKYTQDYDTTETPLTTSSTSKATTSPIASMLNTQLSLVQASSSSSYTATKSFSEQIFSLLV